MSEQRDCENNPLLFDMSYMQFKSHHWDKKKFGVTQEGVQPAECIEVYVQSVGVHRWFPNKR